MGEEKPEADHAPHTWREIQVWEICEHFCLATMKRKQMTAAPASSPHISHSQLQNLITTKVPTAKMMQSDYVHPIDPWCFVCILKKIEVFDRNDYETKSSNKLNKCKQTFLSGLW